jgi:UDP-glucose:(heptosyl)LPS alpha-1,3-glucosyltransferase
MKFAFIIFKYFPYGGVQRDMLRIAQDCVALGHQVTIYTGEWQGEQPSNMQVKLLRPQGWFNHQKQQNLIKAIHAQIGQEAFDLVVGFNRMSGLDVYFAADSCFVAKAHQDKPWWYRFTPRYRWFANAESAIFHVDSPTHILTLTQAEQATFQQWYGTPDERFHLIPPFLSSQRFGDALAISTQARQAIRQQVRAMFGIQPNDKLLLLVGSGFKTKGADRMVEAIYALPQALREQVRAMIIGQDAGQGLQKQIRALGLSAQIQVLPGRDDIPQLMLAADVMVHPARRELAGHVLLEAMACGLPVLTTDKCGYAPHIQQANAGKVLSSPFSQQALDQSLQTLLTRDTEIFQLAGMAYVQQLMQANPGQAEARVLVQLAQLAEKCNKKAELALAIVTASTSSTLWVSASHRSNLQHLQFQDFMALCGHTARATANRRTMRVSIAGKSYFVKQHEGVGWGEIFKNWTSFKRPILGAMTEVRAIHALTQIGIPTTPLVAFGQQGWNPARLRSFLMTEDLGDIISLEELCADWHQQPPTETFKKQLIVAVAKLAAKLHGEGLCHRDFYLCHFVIRESSLASQTMELILIDLHRMLMGQSSHGTAVMKDIAGLYFSAMDCGLNEQDIALFKAHYLPQSEAFWAQVCKRSHRLYAKFNSDKFQQRIQQEQQTIRQQAVDQ